MKHPHVLMTLLILTLLSAESKALDASGPYVKASALGITVGSLAHGKYDAITDVPGVLVGQVTKIQGDGTLVPGKGPVRAGVTAIIPRTDVWHRKVFAATWPFNGNGEMTGTAWITESGFLEVPIVLTDSLNVGRVDDGVVSWMIQHYPQIGIQDDVPLPVVAECDDSFLNDIQGRHASPQDVIDALNRARGGPVSQGGVGAGTGMIAYSFKGGIGTASRVVSAADGGYTVGVLVNDNAERRSSFTVAGVPVGENIRDLQPTEGKRTEGSIIFVVATNAPLLPDALKRLARHVVLGWGRTGATSRTGSGDLVIAFSTANVIPHYPDQLTYPVTAFDLYHMNALFDATIEATDEAVLNALLAGQTMVGRDGNKVYGLPHDRLLRIMHRYGR
ncbi:MAG: P1 family peptidase [Candidatus Eremiobacteraeota bacterium]|nr:P1 family peptidase [Candidatus Eremiobacteraeota bacterium]